MAARSGARTVARMATTIPPRVASFDVAYPDRPLDRLTSALRPFTIIPIAIVWAAVVNYTGLLVLPPALMLIFRQKYPRWWFDFNRELVRFGARIGAYAALLTDRYPSTDEPQDVLLELPEPDVTRLNRWLPLVKWLLALPHYIVLAFLYVGVIVAVVVAWFAILFTGRYPRSLFDFVVGVGRWHVRVMAYAFVLVTDDYPPFRLTA